MEYGKFASAEELLKGYNQLEKSFTQKCQQLSAAEKEVEQLKNASQPSSGTSAEASPQNEAEHTTTVDSAVTVPQGTEDASEPLDGRDTASPIPTEQQLQQYLADNPEVVRRLLQQTSTEFAPDVMTGGGNVSMALPSRPKTIKEASLMAKELFN